MNKPGLRGPRGPRGPRGKRGGFHAITTLDQPRSPRGKPGTCLHCGRDRILRPRRLCSRCYDLPGVREQYPPVGPMGRRGISHDVAGGFAPADAPTDALPGSAEKQAELARRAEQGVRLWCEGDAGLDMS